ncbi:hypothetical protein FB451DRAFT_1524858 [Mycena latifolia]|nr:hypothetical protein FB451DRAFT_1524858 [Mycena latifolia]
MYDAVRKSGDGRAVWTLTCTEAEVKAGRAVDLERAREGDGGQGERRGTSAGAEVIRAGTRNLKSRVPVVATVSTEDKETPRRAKRVRPRASAGLSRVNHVPRRASRPGVPVGRASWSSRRGPSGLVSVVVAVGRCSTARRRRHQRQGKCASRDAGATRRRRKVAWMRLSNPDARLSIPVRDTAILHALVLVSASSRGVLGGKRHGGRRARRGIGFRMLGRRGIGGRWPECGLVPAGPPSIHPSARRVLALLNWQLGGRRQQERVATSRCWGDGFSAGGDWKYRHDLLQRARQVQSNDTVAVSTWGGVERKAGWAGIIGEADGRRSLGGGRHREEGEERRRERVGALAAAPSLTTLTRRGEVSIRIADDGEEGTHWERLSAACLRKWADARRQRKERDAWGRGEGANRRPRASNERVHVGLWWWEAREVRDCLRVCWGIRGWLDGQPPAAVHSMLTNVKAGRTGDRGQPPSVSVASSLVKTQWRVDRVGLLRENPGLEATKPSDYIDGRCWRRWIRAV